MTGSPLEPCLQPPPNHSAQTPKGCPTTICFQYALCITLEVATTTTTSTAPTTTASDDVSTATLPNTTVAGASAGTTINPAAGSQDATRYAFRIQLQDVIPNSATALEQ